jgi:archaea-specific DNA-binding protein
MAEDTTDQPDVRREVQRRNSNDNVVFIGGKPFMNYVTGVVMQFTTQNSKEIVVKARGKFISRAVDVAEVASRRFLENTCDIGKIEIGSEEFKNKEGKQIRVSTIEITLNKK